MLSQEQIKEIKEQLVQQIEANFPEDKKAAAIQQIESMNEEQLEHFLKQNRLIKTGEATEQNIFRSIIEGQIPSYKIDENKYAVAVLEINPVSKGHALIIPKKAINSIEKIPQQVFSLAKKISGKIKAKLKPREISISSANAMGEFIINIVPVYENESMNSQRRKADEEELKSMREKLSEKPKKKIIKITKTPKKTEERIRLPQRIP